MKPKSDKTKIMHRIMAKKANNPKKLGVFAEEIKLEMKRVEWPTRKAVAKSTALILTIVVIVTLFVSLIDAGLSQAFLLLRHS